MKPLSFEPVFLPPTADIAPLLKRIKKSRGVDDTLAALREADFNTAYDYLRTYCADMVSAGDTAQAIDFISSLTDLVAIQPDSNEPPLLDLYTALMQTLTTLYIEADDMEHAATSAATALNLLAQQPKRKDPAHLQLLGCLLFDIAYFHSQRKEYKQAEREIEKSIKIFERLAKSEPDRYAPAHLMSLNGATSVYRNRVKQAELLAHYQTATNTYLQMVNSGVEDATTRLVDSLTDEGDTLANMGRHREAMQYYTRALKYLTKLESDFTPRQLRLSIRLGESMLQVNSMREKGVHLLNTMLHKATKINALDEHRRIVDSLYRAKSRSLDILSLWHKIFPK